MTLDPLAQLARVRTVTEMAAVFADEAAWRRCFEALVWPKGRHCPSCGSLRSFALRSIELGSTKRVGLYQCSDCRRQFTATSGTPLHATKLPLQKWLVGLWLQLQSDKVISSVRLAEAIGVSQPTAWRMGHALRLLMADYRTKLKDIVETDDLRIGGKPRKDPANPEARRGKQGNSTKKPALVVVERPSGDKAGRVRAVPVSSLTQPVVTEALRAIVSPGAHLMTDAGSSFSTVTDPTAPGGPVVTAHDTVVHRNHEFVRGIVHANSAEGFNDRVRRTVVGVFHHIDEKHYRSYLDEIGFRWAQRRCVGIVNRRTRKGRLVARKVWSRIPPAEQVRTLLATASGRRLRRTRNWGIEIIAGPPEHTTPDLHAAPACAHRSGRLDPLLAAFRR